MKKNFINKGENFIETMPVSESEQEVKRDKDWLVGYIKKYLETNDFAETPVDEDSEKRRDGEKKYTERESDRVIDFIIEQSGFGREEVEEILEKNGINLFFLVIKIQEEMENKNKTSKILKPFGQKDKIYGTKTEKKVAEPKKFDWQKAAAGEKPEDYE